MSTNTHDFQQTLSVLNKNIADNLEFYLERFIGQNLFKETYHYSVIPAGKLFRPLLAVLAYCDFNKSTPKNLNLHPKSSIALFSAALELHHVYTLMHDDLPCMDNDNTRRGRPSSHIKFGQWQALLAGDGLSILSFHLMSQMDCQLSQKLLKIATWTTGAKGLIYGQYLDLSQEMNKSFSNVIETHLLKTARLIQLSLLGGQIIAQDHLNNNSKRVWKFGKSLGIIFQLLDDLDDYFELEELTENNAVQQNHEAQINPWINYPEECKFQLIKEIESLKRNSAHLDNCKNYTNYFLKKSSSNLISKINQSKTFNDLVPALSTLNL